MNWNGAALSTVLVSSSEMKASLPANSLSIGSVAMVTVSNPVPGGGASSAVEFDVTSPEPVITSISPKLVAAGAVATIALTGTGFEANSVVLWNGSARTTTFVSATALQVVLSAADLRNPSVGSLTVSNPGPGGSTSGSTQLTVTPPVPTITGVTITSVPANFLTGSDTCPVLQVSVSGTNFASNSMIKVNGTALQNLNYTGDLSTIFNLLPSGFQSKPGALSFTVTNPFPSPTTSTPFAYPANNPPVIAICPTPSAPAVLPSGNFTVAVRSTEVNAGGGEQLTVGALPAGLTVSNATVPLPPSGAVLHFQAASSLAAGTDNIVLTGTAGTATGAATLALTVNPNLQPGFSFVGPLSTALAVPIGGSGSIQYDTSVQPANAEFDITASLSGLPPGTTATISPTVFSPGEIVTITVTAAANAPVTQNAVVTLTGTPSGGVPPVTTTFRLDVTPPPGSLPNNRTDYTSIAGQPFAAVYDSVHDLIFSSNPSWNRVDVLSNKTHQVVKSIPMLSPQGLDITQDGSTVWVGTLSQQIFAINTSRLTTTRYLLPKLNYQNWEDYQLEALADGTVFLSAGLGFPSNSVGVWDPATNVLTPVPLPSGALPGLPWGPISRSGDGTKVYSFNGDSSNCQVLVYDVSAKTVASNGGFDEVCGFYAVNRDGSRLVGANNGRVYLYDSSFNVLGKLSDSSTSYFSGSFIFSRDGSTLYEISGALISTIDVASLRVLGTAPDMSNQPINGGAAVSLPFAVDNTGMMLGIQPFGIGFQDTTFFQTYGATPPPGLSYIASLTPDSGPVSGGTQLTPYGYFGLTPDVWFGNTRGTAMLNGNTLTVTTPPSGVPGPVNMKYLFPDGSQYFSLLGFSYSVTPQYAVFSGASPDGGAPGRITGFGMPLDASGGSITVGGNSAVISPPKSQYMPFTGEPYPDANLNFTVPPGTPGPADITVTTPAGSGTLHQGFFYAKSVKDYPSADSFNSLLFDPVRNQVYLAAGDHVDVFSTTANQFVGPLNPAANAKVKQFSGLALTPDNSQLLVTDLQDGSMAVIDPDSPTNTFAVPITPEYPSINGCPAGPLYVAATSNQQAFVSIGSLPAPSCGNGGGSLFLANLQTKTAVPPPTSPCAFPGGYGGPVDGSTNGNFVVSSGCVYSAQAAAYTAIPFAPVEISGDANVLANVQTNGTVLADINGNRLGSLAAPVALYQSIGLYPLANAPALFRPRLNAAGSLYFVAYPNYLEIFDVLHGKLLMRFSLSETVQNTASPIAIDSGGRHIYLTTDKGLTVIDLGEALLAIGHLSQSAASVGSQVTVRGSGFDASLTATIGGQAAAVSVTDENTLTLNVPAAASGPEDIVLTRGDGATYTLENGITLP